MKYIVKHDPFQQLATYSPKSEAENERFLDFLIDFALAPHDLSWEEHDAARKEIKADLEDATKLRFDGYGIRILRTGA